MGLIDYPKVATTAFITKETVVGGGKQAEEVVEHNGSRFATSMEAIASNLHGWLYVGSDGAPKEGWYLVTREKDAENDNVTIRLKPITYNEARNLLASKDTSNYIISRARNYYD